MNFDVFSVFLLLTASAGASPVPINRDERVVVDVSLGLIKSAGVVSI